MGIKNKPNEQRKDSLYNPYTMLLADWVKKVREKLDLTQEQLGEFLGVTRANVSAWENDLHEPNTMQMAQMSARSGIPMPLKSSLITPIEVIELPLLNFVQAGHWAAMCKNKEEVNRAPIVQIDPKRTRKLSEVAFAIKVKGDSMYPMFMEGDFLVVDPRATVRTNDYVIASIGEEEAVFRQYIGRGHDEQGKPRFELRSLNPAVYPPIRSEEVNADLVGRVIKIERNLPE